MTSLLSPTADIPKHRNHPRDRTIVKLKMLFAFFWGGGGEEGAVSFQFWFLTFDFSQDLPHTFPCKNTGNRSRQASSRRSSVGALHLVPFVSPKLERAPKPEVILNQCPLLGERLTHKGLLFQEIIIYRQKKYTEVVGKLFSSTPTAVRINICSSFDPFPLKSCPLLNVWLGLASHPLLYCAGIKGFRREVWFRHLCHPFLLKWSDPRRLLIRYRLAFRQVAKIRGFCFFFFFFSFMSLNSQSLWLPQSWNILYICTF